MQEESPRSPGRLARFQIALTLAAAAVILVAAWRTWGGRAVDQDLRTLRYAPDWKERANAALRLGRGKRREAVPGLFTALADKSLRVKKNSLWALKELTGQPWGLEEDECRAWWERNRADFLAGRSTPDLPRPAPPPAHAGEPWLQVQLGLGAPPSASPEAPRPSIVARVTLRNRTQAQLTLATRPVEAYDALEFLPGGRFVSVAEPDAPLSYVEVSAEVVEAGGRTVELPQSASAAGLALAPGAEFVLEFELPVPQGWTRLRARLLPALALLQKGDELGTEPLAAPAMEWRPPAPPAPVPPADGGSAARRPG
ncbi:MAG: HEAT repeat domain-containing protein [Planctomycetes bacterium]|nr:HEAT repeat domain-containing protein [Planctomycetota bacterium]